MSALHRLRYRIRGLYWRLLLPRCECSYIIWPWQARVWDEELGSDIHETCASYPESDQEAAS